MNGAFSEGKRPTETAATQELSGEEFDALKAMAPELEGKISAELLRDLKRASGRAEIKDVYERIQREFGDRMASKFLESNVEIKGDDLVKRSGKDEKGFVKQRPWSEMVAEQFDEAVEGKDKVNEYLTKVRELAARGLRVSLHSGSWRSADTLKLVEMSLSGDFKGMLPENGQDAVLNHANKPELYGFFTEARQAVNPLVTEIQRGGVKGMKNFGTAWSNYFSAVGMGWDWEGKMILGERLKEAK